MQSNLNSSNIDKKSGLIKAELQKYRMLKSKGINLSSDNDNLLNGINNQSSSSQFKSVGSYAFNNSNNEISISVSDIQQQPKININTPQPQSNIESNQPNNTSNIKNDKTSFGELLSPLRLDMPNIAISQNSMLIKDDKSIINSGIESDKQGTKINVLNSVSDAKTKEFAKKTLSSSKQGHGGVKHSSTKSLLNSANRGNNDSGTLNNPSLIESNDQNKDSNLTSKYLPNLSPNTAAQNQSSNYFFANNKVSSSPKIQNPEINEIRAAIIANKKDQGTNETSSAGNLIPSASFLKINPKNYAFSDYAQIEDSVDQNPKNNSPQKGSTSINNTDNSVLKADTSSNFAKKYTDKINSISKKNSRTPSHGPKTPDKNNFEISTPTYSNSFISSAHGKKNHSTPRVGLSESMTAYNSTKKHKGNQNEVLDDNVFKMPKFSKKSNSVINDMKSTSRSFKGFQKTNGEPNSASRIRRSKSTMTNSPNRGNKHNTNLSCQKSPQQNYIKQIDSSIGSYFPNSIDDVSLGLDKPTTQREIEISQRKSLPTSSFAKYRTVNTESTVQEGEGGDDTKNSNAQMMEKTYEELQSEVEKWKKFGKLMADSYDELNKKFNNFLKDQEKDKKIIQALKEQVNRLKSLLALKQDNTTGKASETAKYMGLDNFDSEIREENERLKQQNAKLDEKIKKIEKEKEEEVASYKRMAESKFQECTALAEEIICLRTDLDRTHSNYLKLQREQLLNQQNYKNNCEERLDNKIINEPNSAIFPSHTKKGLEFESYTAENKSIFGVKASNTPQGLNHQMNADTKKNTGNDLVEKQVFLKKNKNNGHENINNHKNDNLRTSSSKDKFQKTDNDEDDDPPLPEKYRMMPSSVV